MTNVSHTASPVAVRRGIPSLRRAPRIAALVADVRARAADLGMSLHRFELVPMGAMSTNGTDAYWTVARFPRNVRFADVDEARRMLGEQIHVRVSSDGCELRDTEEAVAELELLRWMVTREVEGAKMGRRSEASQQISQEIARRLTPMRKRADQGQRR